MGGTQVPYTPDQRRTARKAEFRAARNGAKRKYVKKGQMTNSLVGLHSLTDELQRIQTCITTYESLSSEARDFVDAYFTKAL